MNLESNKLLPEPQKCLKSSKKSGICWHPFWDQHSLKFGQEAAHFCDNILESVKKVTRNEKDETVAEVSISLRRCCKNEGLALTNIQCLSQLILRSFLMIVDSHVGRNSSQK